tara:strand:- start:998 stop:1723 length:726 start_codon:yes stop_codon:yes gene_type:complete
MNLAIIVPTYNENENILELIKKIDQNLSVNNIDFKVFIVDDSNQNTILNLIKPFSDKINYHHRGKKLGRGSAVIEGINLALKTKYTDLVIEMDADLSHDPTEMNDKIKIFVNDKLDLLISSRYRKDSKIEGWTIQRTILSFVSNMMAKFLLKVPVTDYTNGYRLYSKKAAEYIVENCGKIGDGFIVLSEILLELHYNNFKIGETFTTFKNREKGSSKVNLKLIFNSFLGLFKLFLIKMRKY